MRKSPLIGIVVGTRPEAIKMEPVTRALATIAGVRQAIFLTGQHRHLEPSFAAPGLALFSGGDLPGDQSFAALRRHFQTGLRERFLRLRPDLVLVHGDTTSALSGALAARDCGIPVGHVEAGLRSFDMRQPWPEEGNRVVIDLLSDLLFAPTPAAADNLCTDRRVKGQIHVTGNTGIDALFAARDRIVHRPRSSERTILVTCHRKENRGRPAEDVCAALKRIVDTLPVEIVFPLHLNPDIRRPFAEALGGYPRIRLIEPLGHEEMVRLMMRSWLILTDSGGLQEEGPALGRPVLVLRNVTERGEALGTGNILLVGTCPERIHMSVTGLYEDEGRYQRMALPSLAFGDGRAAPRIAAIVAAYLSRKHRKSGKPLHAAPILAKDADHGAILDTRQLETV